MGNSGSASRRRRNSNHRQHHHHPEPPSVLPPQPPPPLPQQQQEAAGNRYVFAASTPYPAQYPNPNPPPYYQYAGYYPPPPPAMPVPLPAPFDHHHHPQPHHGWHGTVQRYPCTSANLPPPYVEHQKAVTIRNDVNIKKETLRVEPDEENPGKSLITFTFDATTAGRISVIFFAKEGFDCNLSSVKDVVLEPVTVSFEEGLGQKFKQPFGTGIDFSVFEKEELLKEGEMEVYPLAVKAEASPSDKKGAMDENHSTDITPNSQITLAVFEKKENGKYQVRVVKQILWVNGTRYELQEIYGIGNSVDGDPAGNDPGKECVICLSEPRDTTVLPCRHMCMCSGCAKVLRLQTDRCPICRQPVERLLEIRVNNRGEELQEVPC